MANRGHTDGTSRTCLKLLKLKDGTWKFNIFWFCVSLKIYVQKTTGYIWQSEAKLRNFPSLASNEKKKNPVKITVVR